MTDTTHGYAAQHEFVERWATLGKTAWLHRFSDSSDLYGRNKRLVRTDAQPADFLCGYTGWLGLIECKATKNETGFPVSLVAKPQSIAATLSRAAGTPYKFAIQRTGTKEWFIAPAALILNAKGVVKWDDLQFFLWKNPPSCDLTAMLCAT